MRRCSIVRGSRPAARTTNVRRALCGGALAATLLGGALVQAQESAAPAQNGQDTHSVAEGDTLWGLSGKYLGSSYEWPRLWAYNPEITNPHWIYPGHVLRLREGAAGGFSKGPQGAAAVAGGSQGLLRKGGRPAAPQRVALGQQAYLDPEALKEAARIVGSPEDHMMFSPSDQVYLQLAKNQSMAEGREVLVFRRLHRGELNPRAGTLPLHHAGDGGEIVQVIGVLRVQSVDQDKRIARALVTDASDPIERGFEVADVPRTMTEVPPKTNARRVEARIVAATRPLGTLGQGQVVFINAGAKQGVEVGNRFLVLRQGDAWRQNLTVREELSGEDRPDRNPLPNEAFPWEVVGEVRAVYVRSETTTGYISDSLVELSPGDRVELREGY